jgi:hypothetical protein
MAIPLMQDGHYQYCMLLRKFNYIFIFTTLLINSSILV